MAGRYPSQPPNGSTSLNQPSIQPSSHNSQQLPNPYQPRPYQQPQHQPHSSNPINTNYSIIHRRSNPALSNPSLSSPSLATPQLQPSPLPNRVPPSRGHVRTPSLPNYGNINPTSSPYGSASNLTNLPQRQRSQQQIQRQRPQQHSQQHPPQQHPQQRSTPSHAPIHYIQRSTAPISNVSRVASQHTLPRHGAVVPSRANSQPQLRGFQQRPQPGAIPSQPIRPGQYSTFQQQQQQQQQQQPSAPRTPTSGQRPVMPIHPSQPLTPNRTHQQQQMRSSPNQYPPSLPPSHGFSQTTTPSSPQPPHMGRLPPSAARPLPVQRPIPGQVNNLVNNVHNMGISNQMVSQQAGPPPDMRAIVPTDPASLPRPDLSGPAVSVRINAGDPPPRPPQPDPNSGYLDPTTGQIRSPMVIDPAACPAEIFVPTSPRCVRPCNGAFPFSIALAKKYALPLGAVIQPLAKTAPDDEPVPIVNFGSSGIVRCRRCRSYVNFSCEFKDGGRRWLCSMCNHNNECPSDYFSPLDQNGKRVDAAQRPELHCGSVEFVAPAEYMVRPPMPPVYMFVLETTPAAVNSGALAGAIAGVRNSIDSMPNEGRTRVGIVTFSSSVQFYTMKPGEDAEPSIHIVSDISDVFLPTPNGILVQLSECRPCFERTLEMIAKSHQPTNEAASAPSCLGAALKGAQKAMEYSGGKMIILASSRPTIGPGALRERGDRSMLGTDRERVVLKPDTALYSQMAVTMSKYQISCDMFLCVGSGHYMDVASLAQLVKVTGGELFYCKEFTASQDSPRLQLAINRVLARETGLEAVMRIRATRGIRCTQFSGRFFVRSTDLLALPNVDSDKAYAVQFAFDEGSIGDRPFCLQVALLYTTTSGERRIRVHTIALPVAKTLANLFARVDAPATATIFTRQAAEGMKDRVLSELKKNLTEKVILALAKYRQVCHNQYPSTARSPQLLMPESMALLPVYMLGLAKTPILSRDSSGAFLYSFDDKAALAHDVDVMNVAEISAMLYPSIIPVYPWPTSEGKLVKHPHGVPAASSSLRQDTSLLIDDGRSIILFIGAAVVQPFLKELLGDASNGRIDPRLLTVELMRRGASSRGQINQVYHAVNAVLRSRKPSLPVFLVPSGYQRMQARVEALMTEDRTSALLGYKEFLIEVQRRVTQSVTNK